MYVFIIIFTAGTMMMIDPALTISKTSLFSRKEGGLLIARPRAEVEDHPTMSIPTSVDERYMVESFVD